MSSSRPRFRFFLLSSLLLMVGSLGALVYNWPSLRFDEALGAAQIALALVVVAFFAYRGLMAPWTRSSEVVLHGVPDRLEAEGREVTVEEVRQPGTAPNIIVYGVQLPPQLAALSLIDHGGRAAMSALHLGLPVAPELAPATATGDPSFDGDFDFTEEVVAAEALDLVRDPRVRRTLIDVRDSFGNLWIERGVLRVSEEGPYFPDGGRAAADRLVWACAELETLVDDDEVVLSDEAEVVLDLEQSVERSSH